MFFIRPRSQQARRQRETLMELSAGDEVLTGAGIFGTVLDVESDRVTLETAPGTRITVLRSTIARRITDPAVETPSWDEHDEDEAHGAYHEYEHDEHDEHTGHEDGAEHEDEDSDHDEDSAHDEHEDGAEHEDPDSEVHAEAEPDAAPDAAPDAEDSGDKKKT
jgi:preprotein translocase subunit YajC